MTDHELYCKFVLSIGARFETHRATLIGALQAFGWDIDEKIQAAAQPISAAGQAKSLLMSLRQRAIPICSAVLLERNAKFDNDSSSSFLGYLLQLFSIHYQCID
jgi:hypothetical protein